MGQMPLHQDLFPKFSREKSFPALIPLQDFGEVTSFLGKVNSIKVEKN